jgi:hypothetical protein
MAWLIWLLAALGLYMITSRLVMRAWRLRQLRELVGYIKTKQPDWTVSIHGEHTLSIRGLADGERRIDVTAVLAELLVEQNLRQMKRSSVDAEQARQQIHERWLAQLRGG